MNVTIQTLTVQVENKSVPLTKAMVNQIPMAEHEFQNNERFHHQTGDCSSIGEVCPKEGEIYILVNTPRGLRKMFSDTKRIFNDERRKNGFAPIERLILLK